MKSSQRTRAPHGTTLEVLPGPRARQRRGLPSTAGPSSHVCSHR